MNITRITVFTLLEWFTTNSPNIPETLILDVREDDYTSGKIPGSINFPFHSFTASLPTIKDLLQGKKYAILHCHFSQMRGPAAAEILVKSLNDTDVQVFVLEGGWKTWKLVCSSEYPHLIEQIPPKNRQNHEEL